ncbi:hypothetical protein DRO38_06335 [Candidatus Bathyarchaeota archaeon]|nr:MAG: hypothetical protein DRO38_06335 [Candidatus Bathyarchaeota archaeon]
MQIKLALLGRVYLNIMGKKIEIPFSASKKIQRKGEFHCKVNGLEIAQRKDEILLSSAFSITGPLPSKPIKAKVAFEIFAFRNLSLAKGETTLQTISQKENALMGKASFHMARKVLRKLKKRYGGKRVPISLKGKLRLWMEREEIRLPFCIQKEIVLKQKPLSIAIKGIRVSRISPKAIFLRLKLELKSHLSKEIQRVRAKFRAFANGKAILSSGRMDIPLLSPTTVAKIDLPLTIYWKTLKEVKVRNRGKQTRLSFKGRISAKIDKREFTIPFSFQKQMILPEKPFSIKLKKLKILKLVGKRRKFLLTLQITNKGHLAIRDLAIRGKVILSDKIEMEIGKEHFTLLPHQSKIIKTTLLVKRFGLVKLLRTWIKSRRTLGKWRLKLSGKREDGMDISLEDKGKEMMKVEK